MSNPAYNKRRIDKPFYYGPRVVSGEDLGILSEASRAKVQVILDAMVWPQLVSFHYGDSDRLVAPFVIGVSSIGNPLLRGYQVRGVSKSGKGPGWRVFQVVEMESVENYEEFFDPLDFGFDGFYPWMYKVFRELQGDERSGAVK